jgi:hypothetical protein
VLNPLAPLALLAWLGGLHPIHSSSASLTLSASGRVEIVLRVFANDFPPGRVPATIERYLATRFGLYDRNGSRLATPLDSIREEGPVLTIRLTALVPKGLAGARVWHGVLGERFRDQVNILQARYGGRSVTLLFTASDGPKPLP